MGSVSKSQSPARVRLGWGDSHLQKDAGRRQKDGTFEVRCLSVLSWIRVRWGRRGFRRRRGSGNFLSSGVSYANRTGPKGTWRGGRNKAGQGRKSPQQEIVFTDSWKSLFLSGWDAVGCFFRSSCEMFITAGWTLNGGTIYFFFLNQSFHFNSWQNYQ